MWIGLITVGLGLESLAESPRRMGALSARETVVFDRICAHCHAQTGIGVPIIGDETDWQTRRSAGLDRLLARTIEGYGKMPPLGTCGFCTEDELRRLVVFIAGFPMADVP